MKIKYRTIHETAVVLREMSGNCGSSGESLRNAGMSGAADRMASAAEKSIESYMTGIVEVNEATPEAVLRGFQNCRSFRTKTIARLAKTVQIETLI